MSSETVLDFGVRRTCFSSDRKLGLPRFHAASWINPAPTPSITPERKIPPKFPNFGKAFPFLPGKRRHYSEHIKKYLTKEVHRMKAGMRKAMLLLSATTMTLLALTACSGGASQEEAKARPLPEQHQDLRPGEYRTEEFKPSASFRIGEGWLTSPPEGSEVLQLEYGMTTGLAFTNVQGVYKPTESGTTKVIEPPEDLADWFQHHPYLKTGKPEPITVGGVKGVEFDVALAEDLPKDHTSECGTDCVDLLSNQGSGHPIAYEGDKTHYVVLEDVKGETVTIDYGGLATDFDKVAPEAQKLVDSVQWGGS
jgi:hypothetical protein